MIGGIYGGSFEFVGAGLGSYLFFYLFLLIASGCLWELGGLLLPKDEKYRLVRRLIGCLMGILPILWIGHKILFYMVFGSDFNPEQYIKARWSAPFTTTAEILVLEIILVFLALVFELFSNSRSPFQNVATYVLGIFYISFPTVLLFSLATQDAVSYQPHRVFGILWLIWTNDTMAYLIGSRIGRTKLFERISPKKTWEGAIGGGLCTVVMAWLISLYFNDFSQAQWLALGGVVAVFGNLGDLVESMLKRSVNVKDSGTLLPGHGGLLDRFDSFIFVLPFAWLVSVLV